MPVNDRPTPTVPPRIVVGVDGSPSSGAALRWATGQAALTGATLEAVIAWEFPAAVGGYGWAPAVVISSGEYNELAQKVLAEAISNDVGPASGVQVITRVMEGNAAQVLLDAADGADLLVVGCRGHGNFASALLGSVSQHCVHHATCPIVVIHGSKPVH